MCLLYTALESIDVNTTVTANREVYVITAIKSIQNIMAITAIAVITAVMVITAFKAITANIFIFKTTTIANIEKLQGVHIKLQVVLQERKVASLNNFDRFDLY